MTIDEGPAPEHIERRKDRLDLTQLRQEVAELEESNQILAGAVTRILPNQIQIGVAEIRRLFIQLAIVISVATVTAVTVVAVLMGQKTSQINDHVDQGHDVISCVLRIPEAARTDVTVLTCQQVARGQ